MLYLEKAPSDNTLYLKYVILYESLKALLEDQTEFRIRFKFRRHTAWIDTGLQLHLSNELRDEKG